MQIEITKSQNGKFLIHSNKLSIQDKERRKDKEPEKEKKKKRRKTETDSEEEKEEFQLFFVEDKLTVAHRPNSQGSSATTGTLYPALVRK